jgi:hypothetical protein
MHKDAVQQKLPRRRPRRTFVTIPRRAVQCRQECQTTEYLSSVSRKKVSMKKEEREDGGEATTGLYLTTEGRDPSVVTRDRLTGETSVGRREGEKWVYWCTDRFHILLVGDHRFVPTQYGRYRPPPPPPLHLLFLLFSYLPSCDSPSSSIRWSDCQLVSEMKVLRTFISLTSLLV